jgi:RecJ-like exonuclease
LKEIGVDPKDDGEWRYLDDLSPEEHQRLVTGIIMRRRGEDVPEDILSNVYTLPQEEGIFRDAKEFSTLLNACGRLDEAQVGLDACLDRPGARERAVEVKAEYKAEIVRALNWYEDHRESEYVTEGDGYVIINAEENVLNTIVGTIISILSKGGEYSPGTLFLSMARKHDDVTKVSIRVADNPEGVRLNELIAELASHVGGESGGHQYAAGAIIPTSKEEAFISHAVDVFERHTT